MSLELVVATGDPQGIGPEVSAAAARELAGGRRDLQVVLVGDPEMLGRAGISDLGAQEQLRVHPVPLPQPLEGPPPSPAGGAAALAALEAALARVRQEPQRRALVTAPLSKEAVAAAAEPGFRGHTGWLAARLGAGPPVMLFDAGELRVALATVHLPLREVAEHLTVEGLAATLAVVRRGLQDLYGIPDPRLQVLALNPHAGEGGLLGSEEAEVLEPALEAHRRAGGRVEGPFSADSWFARRRTPPPDAVLAAYHDQGLIPVKLLGGGRAVNVTLGLPVVRTSVDHGCAFDLAGRGLADPGSMLAALELAARLLQRRREAAG